MTDRNGKEQRGDVECTFFVKPDDRLADPLGMLVADRAHAAQFDHVDDLLIELALELVEALAADAQQLDLLAFPCQRVGAFAREPHDRRVEGPHRPRSAVHTTSRCTLAVPVPASSFGAEARSVTEAAMLLRIFSMRAA